MSKDCEELTEFCSVDVEIHGENGPAIQVCVPGKRSKHRLTVDDILSKICEQLGLSEKSSSHFTLVQENKDGLPEHKYNPGETLDSALSQGLCLQKWLFDTETEKTLVDDESSLHLLYLHARHHVNTEKTALDPEKKAELEGFEKANFVQERQYVLTCQSLPLYHAIRFPGCRLRKQFIIAELPVDGHCTLLLSKQGLHLKTGSRIYGAPWVRLKSWGASSHNTWVVFAVMLDTGITSLLNLASPQTEYILAVINDIIRQVQLDHDETPHFHTDMIHRYADYTEWDNVLYEPDAKYPVMDASIDMCALTHFTPSP